MNSLLTHFFSMLISGYSAGHLLYRLSSSTLFEDVSLLTLALCFTLPAFALRAFAGFSADFYDKKDKKLPSGRVLATLGPVFSIASLIVGIFSPYPAAVLSGLGAALTATAAGIDSLTSVPGYTRAGIVISAAPVGFVAGMHFAETGIFPLQYSVVLLAFITLCAFNFCISRRSSNCMSSETAEKEENGLRRLLLSSSPVISLRAVSVPLVMLVTAALSFSGFAAFAPVSESRFAWLLPAFAVLAGMFAGGIFADTLGARFTASAALLISAPLFFLGTEKYIMFVAALFFASSALPVLICTLAGALRGYEGTSFGLSSMMLFLGGALAQVVTGKLIPLPESEDAVADAAKAGSELLENADEILEEIVEVPGYAKFLIPAMLILSAAIVFFTVENRRIKAVAEVRATEKSKEE